LETKSNIGGELGSRKRKSNRHSTQRGFRYPQPELVLKGATTYTGKVTDTAHGTIRSVEYALQHLEEVAETLARNITDTRKRLADTQAQVNAAFEYAERLAELAKRQQKIEDELDLTKNQASAQLGTGSAGEVATAETDADSLKEDHGGGW